MTAASVILVSDSHLSQAAPEAQGNWDAVVGYISAASPEAAAGPELATSPPYRFWPPPARHRLGNLLKDKPTALIVSGHVHQYRLLRVEGTDHVWAPTTWAVLPDEVEPVLGAKRCGIVSFMLAPGTPAQPRLVEPAGIAQLTIIRDIPDPYHRLPGRA